MNNKINIQLRDNQWYANAYEFVSDNQELKEKQLYSSWWDDIKKLRNINNLISEGKLVTIPPREKYKNGDILQGKFKSIGEGNGIYIFQNGKFWKGTFYDWNLHGNGIFYDKNGNCLGEKRYEYNVPLNK